MDVDLGTVECASAFVDPEGQPPLLQRLAQRLRGMLPHHRVPNGLLRPGRHHDGVFGETEGVKKLESQVQDPADFVYYLIGAAKDVGIVLGEAPNPHQTVQHATALVAVHRAQFAVSYRQLPVTTQRRLVDHDMKWAVHGLEEVFLLVHFQRAVHILPEKFQMTAGLPQTAPSYVGGVDDVIAPAAVKFSPVIFDEGPHEAAFGMPNDQPRPNLIMDAVESQLPAQSAVVPPLRFLQTRQVGVQRLLALEGGPVDPLQHGPMLVAPPVCAGDG